MTHVPASTPVDTPRLPDAPEGAGTSLQALLRAVRPVLGSGMDAAAASAGSLERLSKGGDPPLIAACVPIEGAQPRLLQPAETPGVSAFLDGVQRSRVVGYVAASPVIVATVAAAIRVRTNRQLATWRRPLVRHVLLASRTAVGESVWDALAEAGVPLCDATDVRAQGLAVHPAATSARALALVAEQREQCERHLAAEWCASESRWLWIDGGVSGHLAVEAEATAFGVVKSHTTLYGDDDAVRAVLGLPAGARSPLFLVQHHGRRAVASWYVRLHVARHGDPLHGLVRVEVAPPNLTHDADADALMSQASVAALTARADDVTRWILAERAPLALPDPRWDTLTYGVSSCEHYLHALIGP